MPTPTTAFISDLHIGNHARFSGRVESGVNGRCRELLEATRKALAAAEAAGVRAVVVCGDVFDSDRPSPQVVAATMEVFGATKLPVILLKGNHDCHSDDFGDNALATMHHLPSVAVIDTPVYMEDMDIMAVPFSSQQVGVVGSYLQGVCTQGSGDTILVGHFGIAHKRTPGFLASTANCVVDKALVELCKARNYKAVVAGDWHVPYLSMNTGVTLVQVGALAPVNFNDGEASGGVLLSFSDGTFSRISVDGPRFITVRGVEDVVERVGCLHPYVRVLVQPEMLQDTMALVRKQWPEGSVIHEPPEGDVLQDAEALTRHWTSEAVEEATAEWAADHVPDKFQQDVVYHVMRHIHTARHT